MLRYQYIRLLQLSRQKHKQHRTTLQGQDSDGEGKSNHAYLPFPRRNNNCSLISNSNTIQSFVDILYFIAAVITLDRFINHIE